VRQRSRWFQGHVTCWIHIPGILKSELRLSTRIDTVYYLLGITMVFLFFPATFLFLLGAFFVLGTGAASVGDLFYGGFWPYLLLLYLLSFGPLPVLTVIYWKEDGNVGLLRAIIRAHIFTVVYYVWFVAGCIAIFRLARGESSWAKTERTKQPASV
jgi:cellulose synthase/poly-beta-1,6-N-acetylglucosamine synthase-like glycosyltransferase